MQFFITHNQTKVDRLIAEFAQKDKTTADLLDRVIATRWSHVRLKLR